MAFLGPCLRRSMACLLLACGALSGCGSKETQVRDAYSNYQAAAAANDMAGAQQALLQLVAIDDRVAEYWIELARLQAATGSVGAAYHSLTRAYELDRSNVGLLRALTEFALRGGDPAMAQVYARELDVVSPGDPWVKLTRGYVALRESRYDEALRRRQRIARRVAVRFSCEGAEGEGAFGEAAGRGSGGVAHRTDSGRAFRCDRTATSREHLRATSRLAASLTNRTSACPAAAWRSRNMLCSQSLRPSRRDNRHRGGAIPGICSVPVQIPVLFPECSTFGPKTGRAAARRGCDQAGSGCPRSTPEAPIRRFPQPRRQPDRSATAGGRCSQIPD